MARTVILLLVVALESVLALSLNDTDASLEDSPRRGRGIVEERIEVTGPGRKVKRQIITIPPSVSKVKLVQPPLNLRHSRAPQQFKRFPGGFRASKRPTKKSYQLEESFERKFPQEFYRDERQKPRKVVKVRRKKPKINVEMEDGGEDGTYGASSIHMHQVPPPNLFPVNFDIPDKNYVPGLSIKKLPLKSRQIQSLFAQQYTTHNPHVTTNFGFGGNNRFQYGAFQKGSFVDTTPYEVVTLGKFNQPTVAASEQVVTSLPVHTPGIQVIQPPQFTDVSAKNPSAPSRLVDPQRESETSSQRATIRDILDQDCPLYESKGFCESPPRYPMQQITGVIKRCANLMEVMNTQPFDEPQDVYPFSKRSDTDQGSNSTDPENGSSWSRSSSDELTACTSDLTFAEPGYAREVTSGKWFVIVQHPDTTIQRIATDTCRSPGKPCAGLSGLKCSKVNGFPNKSTKCVQRFTYQRLISWDPEHPEGCPRMRVFRFPSACVCHFPG